MPIAPHSLPAAARAGIALALTGLGSSAAAQSVSIPKPSPKLVELTEHTVRIPSVTRKDREFFVDVYVPKNLVAPPEGIPWVLYLHGDRTTPVVFRRRLAPALDKKFAAGELPPFAVVVPLTGRDVGWFNDESGDNWEDHLLGELPPEVQSRFGLARDRSRRSVVGVGVGGWAALRFSLGYPSQFAHVAVVNGAFPMADVEQLSEVQLQFLRKLAVTAGQGFFAQEPPHALVPKALRAATPIHQLRARDRDELRGLDFAFYNSAEDSYELLDAARELSAALELAGVTPTEELLPASGIRADSAAAFQGSAAAFERFGNALTPAKK